VAGVGPTHRCGNATTLRFGKEVSSAIYRTTPSERVKGKRKRKGKKKKIKREKLGERQRK
jgi:hypothetical protein